MKIGAYVHLSQTGDPTTGVGKHIINMVRGLHDCGQNLHAMVPRCDLEPDGRIGPQSRLEGIPVAPLPWSRWAMERAWLATGLPKSERFVPNGVDWIYSATETYVATRARSAATFHCVNWFDPEVPWYNSSGMQRARFRLGIKWRKTLSKANLILTVSEFLKSRIVELFGTDASKIVVIGNGVEQPFFDVANRDPASLRRFIDRPYVLVIGGLAERKGAPCVLAVADALAERKSEVAVAIVGNSAKDFDQRAAGHPQIVRWGPRGLDELPEMLRGSVALLFPSRYETFGIPAAEAMVAGVPAIVSQFAALPEIVGDAGLIIDTARPAEIASRIDQLARDSKLRDDYGLKGRALAERFRWRHCVDRLVKAITKS